jgi:hypothetical protein
MPTLHWIGKDKVVNHHLDVPFRVLEHSYGYGNGVQTEQDETYAVDHDFWATINVRK